MGTVASDRARAGLLIDARRAGDALAVLAPILAADPDDFIALRLVAMAESQLGRHRESLEAATAATRASPDDDLSWRLVAVAASSLDMHSEAADAAERACRLAPDTWRNHYMVVMVDTAAHEISPRTDSAARELRRLAPDQPDAHFALGRLAWARSDWPTAEQEYRKGLELDPSDHLAQNNLSATLMNQKKYSAAAGGFTRTLGAHPTLEIARRNLFLTGRGIVFRWCLFSILATVIIWCADLAGIDASAASTRAIEGFRIVVLLGLAALVVVQVVLLSRAIGSRARTMLRQLSTDKAIRTGSVFFLVSYCLLIMTAVVPMSPVMSTSGPAILVAVIGAVSVRAL